MLINEAISRIKTPLNHGVASDDDRYSDQYIYSNILTTRSKLLKQKLDSDKYISPFNYTTIPCLPLELGKFSDCPCFTNDCYILRSKDELPKILAGEHDDAVKVFTIDGQIVSPTTWQKHQFKNETKTKKDSIGFFIYNKKLYIVGTTEWKVVTLQAIFHDPTEVQDIDACDTEGNPTGNSCYDPTEDDFPMDEDLFDNLEQLVLEKLLRSFERLPEDNENNAKDVEVTKHME